MFVLCCMFVGYLYAFRFVLIWIAFCSVRFSWILFCFYSEWNRWDDIPTSVRNNTSILFSFCSFCFSFSFSFSSFFSVVVVVDFFRSCCNRNKYFFFCVLTLTLSHELFAVLCLYNSAGCFYIHFNYRFLFCICRVPVYMRLIFL